LKSPFITGQDTRIWPDSQRSQGFPNRPDADWGKAKSRFVASDDHCHRSSANRTICTLSTAVRKPWFQVRNIAQFEFVQWNRFHVIKVANGQTDICLEGR
jgi:hypothetical protein